MIVGITKDKMKNIAPLYDGWDETLIWSCLQGHLGSAFTEDATWADAGEPSVAQIIIGDFYFYAGSATSPAAKELIRNIPSGYARDYALMTPIDETWYRLIEDAYTGQYEKNTRYAIKKEPGVFNKAALNKYINALPEGYSIAPIDESLYNWTKTENWATDFCYLFKTYDDYRNHGVGYVVLCGDKPVCGASSLTYYDKGIEIEIATLPEHRRRGLATACAAQLILTCLDKGLYPSWDAGNRESLALAEKLGYRFDKEYITYEVVLNSTNKEEC